MTYELPRTKDGEIDWEKVANDVYDSIEYATNPTWENILRTIDANARTETVDACIAEATRVFAKGSAHHSYFRNGWNEACRDIADRLKGLKP